MFLRAAVVVMLLLLPLPSRADENDDVITALAERVGASVVRLGMFQADDQQGHGTGFFISADGLVVTNHHVVDHPGGEFFAVFRDGSRKKVLGSLALDEEHDLAILRVEGSGYPALELAPPDGVKTGQRVVLIGSPFGFDQSVGVGTVSAVRPDYPDELKKRWEKANKKVEKGPIVQHSAASGPGASGSPIVDLAGKVVAVNHSGYDGSQTYFGAHVDALRALIAATDLKAEPRPLGHDVNKNLLISGAFFAVLALVFVVVPAIQNMLRRNRRRHLDVA
ncbi:MAG: serine protease [Myxococcota bacterium]